MALIVTVVRGAAAGKRIDVAGTRVTFGRGPDNDVMFPPDDVHASIRHAEARLVEGRWLLSDLGSTNGTFVGGQRIGREHALQNGVQLEFGTGGPVVQVHIAGEATGQRTVMAPVPAGSGGRTAFYRALVDDGVRKASRTLRWTIAVAVGTLVLGGAVAAYVLTRPPAEERASEGDTAKSIAVRFEKALFMLIAQADGHETGFCTAFAVSVDGVLATNAHCVQTLKDLQASGAAIVARMNRDPASTWPVTRWKEHPGYQGKPMSADVGVVLLGLGGRTLPVATTLASDDVQRSLAAGEPIYTLGFPGQVMNEARPAADFRAAYVSRLTTYDNTPGTPATSRVVWHSALTSKGTSGSPIFNESGEVVAVNNGGLSAREVWIKDPQGTFRPEVTYEATGLNFGIRADALRELLDGGRP